MFISAWLLRFIVVKVFSCIYSKLNFFQQAVFANQKFDILQPITTEIYAYQNGR